MFDVSFGELLLILIVGLLVFGPEKLPQVVRTGSLWIARLRRSFNQIRADIEREVGVDDIKRDIHNHSILESLREVKKDLQDTHRQLDQLPYEVNQSVRDNFSQAVHAEHTIPDNDFQHSDNQHLVATHHDADSDVIPHSDINLKTDAAKPALTAVTGHTDTPTDNNTVNNTENNSPAAANPSRPS